MFEINNYFTAGKFFLIIAGELVVIFIVMAFLFSSPVLNPVIVGLLLMLLGLKVTAVVAGYVVDFMGIAPIINGIAK